MSPRRRITAESPNASPEELAQQIRTTLESSSPEPRAVPAAPPEPAERSAKPEERQLIAQDILLKDIDPRGSNVRTRMNPEELENLVASIRQHGLLEPILVQALPKSRGYRYRLIAGFRRVAACRQVPLTVVPARIIVGPLDETEIQQLQLTENLQREAMTIHDIVASIEALRAAGWTQQQVADRLNFSVAKVRVYLQLGDVMRKNKKLALYIDQGLIGIAHFQAAYELITKTRRKLDTYVDSEAVKNEILEQAEKLFIAMLDRLMAEQRLTVRTITQEVSRLLALAGMGEPLEEAGSTSEPPSRPLPIKAVLTSFQRLPIQQLGTEELKEIITVGQAQIRLAQARLKELEGEASGKTRRTTSRDGGDG
ncbi:MAG: ParB/RepB/Spo0J family partition protein [Firmicutes bacterium]|nr:ParB/RepB/Spo0J family partition protein [Bacillota bacterium]